MRRPGCVRGGCPPARPGPARTADRTTTRRPAIRYRVRQPASPRGRRQVVGVEAERPTRIAVTITPDLHLVLVSEPVTGGSRTGVRLRGHADVEAGELTVRLRFGDADWLAADTARGVTAWLVEPDPKRWLRAVDRVRNRLGAPTADRAADLVRDGRLRAAVDLLLPYYDRGYRPHQAALAGPVIAHVDVDAAHAGTGRAPCRRCPPAAPAGPSNAISPVARTAGRHQPREARS